MITPKTKQERPLATRFAFHLSLLAVILLATLLFSSGKAADEWAANKPRRVTGGCLLSPDKASCREADDPIQRRNSYDGRCLRYLRTCGRQENGACDWNPEEKERTETCFADLLRDSDR